MSEEEFVLEESAGGEEFETIPDGTMVEAEVLKVEKRLHPYFKDDQGNPEPKVNFTFRVVEEGQWKNRQVFGETPTTFTSHEDCKLRQWVEEILAVDTLEPGFRFTLQDLAKARCLIVIGAQYWPNKKDPTKTDSKNLVTDVIKSRDAVSVSAPAPAPVEQPALDDDTGEEPF